MERLSQICGPILMKKFGFQLFSDADPTEDVQFIGRLWRGKKKIKEEQTPAEVFNALFVGHLPPGCMTAATYLTFITLAYYDVVFGMRASEIASTSEELLNSIYRFDLQI